MMPYKSEKIKLPRELDRRVKLTDEQREEIRYKYSTGFYSQRNLAAEYGVSKRTIQFTLDEDKRRRAQEAFKERRKDGRYKVSKEERNAIQREHRRYKENLKKSGLLKEENSNGQIEIPDKE